jgi:N-hydroxyarylamine O-acetyltransferase
MQGIALDFTPEPIYKKIVERRRGGVCYENNSLFHWALVEMGFDAKIIRAEMFPGATFRNHFDHMAVIVSLSGIDYLVDVGNGKSFGAPIAVEGGDHVRGEGGQYRIETYGDEDRVLCFFEKDEWHYRYAFQTQAKTHADFRDVCRFIETSEESTFTGKKLATVYRPSGRATLSGFELTTQTQHGVEKRTIDKSDYVQVLLDEFGLVV